jgi:hypothetical protein
MDDSTLHPVEQVRDLNNRILNMKTLVLDY